MLNPLKVVFYILKFGYHHWNEKHLGVQISITKVFRNQNGEIIRKNISTKWGSSKNIFCLSPFDVEVSGLFVNMDGHPPRIKNGNYGGRLC